MSRRRGNHGLSDAEGSELVLELFGLRSVPKEEQPLRLSVYSTSFGVSNPGGGRWGRGGSSDEEGQENDEEEEGGARERRQASTSSLNLMVRFSRNVIRGVAPHVFNGAKFERFRLIAFRADKLTDDKEEEEANGNEDGNSKKEQPSKRQLWRAGLLRYTPVFIYESVGPCFVESFQMSGSSGSDEHFSVSISLDCQGVQYHTQDAEEDEQNFGSDDDFDDDVEAKRQAHASRGLVLGATCSYSQRQRKTVVTEFGAPAVWTPQTHGERKLWPTAFRAAVFAFLQVRHEVPFVRKLPKDVLFHIIRFVSAHYSKMLQRYVNPNPFADVTYYGRPLSYQEKRRR